MENQLLEERLENIEKLLTSQKNVLTFTEACGFTGISKTYMYKLTSKNRIPYFKPHGKNIYFSREELEKWLLKNPVKTAEQTEQEAVNHAVLKSKK